MKARLLSLLAAVAVASPLIGSDAGAAAAPLTREEALKASPSLLIRRALQQAAPEYTEVERPLYQSPFAPRGELGSLRFATKPRSSGDPGLCQASVLTIDLSSSGEPIRSRLAYRVVGDLKPLPDIWNDAYGKALDRKCAAAGPVLPVDNRRFDQLPFFSADVREDRAWTAVRALTLALDRFKAAPASTPCKPLTWPDEERPDLCATPAKLIPFLSVDRLMKVSMKPCPDDAKLRCVEGEFLERAVYNEQSTWTLRLRADVSDSSPNRDVVAVSGLSLEAGGAIYD